MADLVIVESPSKAKKIKEILGAGYVVTASVGHIRDLPPKDRGIESETFRPKYEATERGREVIAKLREAVKSAGTVYLATDPDREGEAIAWHIKDALGLKSYQRATFNEITAAAVKAALAAPRQLNMPLVAAQEARRVLDRIVGWDASPVLWRAVGEGTSAGRVQSPAVRLVVERERAIRDFKPVSHFGVRLGFAGPWSADLDTKSLVPAVAPPDHYLLDRGLAERVAAVRNVTVTAFDDSKRAVGPKAPFTTSTMQQAASIALKLDPADTMRAAQKLFEGGHITYHRTDLPNLSAEGYDMACAQARALGWPVADKRRTWPSKDGAQEAHEAIRPTHFEKDEAGETDSEMALYRLIRLHTLASVLADAIYAVRQVKLNGATADGQPLAFVGRGRALIEPGWRQVYQDATEEDEADDLSNQIPVLAVGTALTAESGRLVEKSTKAPPRYTQASLIKKLEESGIGRPATYAAIMENISKREYITQNAKRQLAATALGEKVVDALAGHVGFIDYDYTAQLEGQLDEIAAGKAQARPVLAAAHDRLAAELTTVKSSAPVYPCPTCGAAMARRWTEKGGQKSFFWACTAYKKDDPASCRETRPDDNGKPGEKVVRQDVPADQRIYFVVPFDNKDAGKKAGLRWDGDAKKWFAPSQTIAAVAAKVKGLKRA